MHLGCSRQYRDVARRSRERQKQARVVAIGAIHHLGYAAVTGEISSFAYFCHLIIGLKAMGMQAAGHRVGALTDNRFAKKPRFIRNGVGVMANKSWGNSVPAGRLKKLQALPI